MTLTREGTAGSVEVDGVRLSYNTAGAGPALIAIHGGGPGASGWANYARNIEALAGSSEVFLVDLPGFGRSDNVPLARPVLHFYARWIRGFMRQMGIARATLVGNSLGGAVAMRLAIENPELVSGLILMGPAGGHQLFTQNPAQLYVNYYDDPTRERIIPFLRNMVYDPSSVTEDLIDERFEVSLRSAIVRDPPMHPWVQIAHGELAGELENVSPPTLLVWGRDDQAVGLDAAVYLAHALPNADLHVFSRCGHWVQWERPADFNALATHFLARQRALREAA